MAEIKTLAKETAIYGISSIVGKFLNWCLVPLYTYVLSSSADYGVVTNLYAWTALLLVILTYGMETGLFRFINDGKADSQTVYSTAFITVSATSVLFALLCVCLQQPMAQALGYSAHPEFIAMMAVVVSMDALASIPFAYLRYQKRPLVFAGLKLAFVALNILLNLFFLLLCPRIYQVHPQWIEWFYNPNYGVGYVFVANLMATALQTLLLLPFVWVRRPCYDVALVKRMLRYSLPLLLLGVVGIMNQTVDKIIFPFLYEDAIEGATQLGIYGACFKVAMVMMMFTQAFRYAYEPFVFAKHKEKNSAETLSTTMRFYIITSLFIFVGMVAYLDILKYLIRSDYWGGLRVVPIILVSYLFQGIYFNLSMWYKLTDRTRYGAYMSLVGCIINVALIVLLVPRIGYMGAAWASLVAYFCVMLLSYALGQKYLPVNYPLRAMGAYALLAIALFVAMWFAKPLPLYARLIINTLCVLAFLAYMIKRDMPLSAWPVVGKYFKK